MTENDILEYDVYKTPQEVYDIPKEPPRYRPKSPWRYSKWNKVWTNSIPYFDWLFVFCLYDKDVKLVTTENHFRYHIINKRNKGVPFDKCPEYVQKEFIYQLKFLEKEGLISKERRNE